MTKRFSKKARGKGVALLALAGVTVLAASLAAVAAGAPTGSSATPAQIQATINKALAANVPAKSLAPIMRDAFARAANPVSKATQDKAFECWKAGKCTLGPGKYTLGVADGFGDNTWRKFSEMEAILQAMTHPEIGKFIYTNAHGQLATMQANLRSLTAQGAKLIIAYNDFGPAAAPAFEAAQRAGAITSTFVSPSRPIGGMSEKAVGIAVGPDICQNGVVMANATVKAIGKTGQVAFFTGTPGNPQDTAWQKCAEQTFKKSYPGITVTFRADTNWTPSGVFQASSALISSGKPVKAILYSYSNPIPQLIKAYQDAGKPIPAVITWTQDNGTSCQWKKLKEQGKGFPLYQTNGINWVARVSTTAALYRALGKKVPSTVIYPQPFIAAKPSDCVPSFPADFPGSSSLVPLPLIKRMLAG